MPRYAAFLRGVSPVNASMADLKRSVERAGFTNVRTLLSSGNVVFDAPGSSAGAIAGKLESAISRDLKRTFLTIVRPVNHLKRILEADPFAGFRLPADAKKIVTFLQEPHRGDLPLPIQQDGVQILAVSGLEVFTVYERSPKGPVFMTMIEKTFGTSQTTRTWDTIKKCAAA